jgi:hypothetical protein
MEHTNIEISPCTCLENNSSIYMEHYAMIKLYSFSTFQGEATRGMIVLMMKAVAASYDAACIS